MTQAYSRALNYLTARNRTVKETADFLTRRGYSDPEIQEAIDRLLELDLLNDRRTASEWVEYCLNCRPRGRDRLRLELQKRGVAKEVIAEVLETLDGGTEFDMAVQLLAPRPVSLWSREKLWRFLRYRGFSFEVIERVSQYYENLTGIQ